MLEVLVASGVIILALGSIITLTWFNIIGQKVSEEEVITSNLAREGIEAVRNFRDTDWLGGSAVINWTGQHTAIAGFNATNNSWSLDYSWLYTLVHPGTKLYLKNNLYVHDAVGSVKTKFNRLITIEYVCLNPNDCPVAAPAGICGPWEGTCSDSDSDGQPDIIAFRVSSKVRRTDDVDSFHDYELTDYLYEWR